MKILKTLLAFTAIPHGRGASYLSLRGIVGLKPDAASNVAHLSGNHAASAIQPDQWDWDRYGHMSPEQLDAWNLKDKLDPSVNPSTLGVNATATNVSTFVGTNSTHIPFRYIGCSVVPSQSCAVNVQQVTADLAGRIVLFLGCSLDIYALNYFCKAANAPVVGFERHPGKEVYGAENFAYCNVGGMILAYSFHPGSSGPPYFEACENVLHSRCSQVTSQQLAQASVAKVVQTFGVPPSAIVVDSSLWDAANWWAQEGKPPEPFLVSKARISRWCSQELPHFINTVATISPLSVIAYRTAPRVEPAFGYGHSMHNIDWMNACYRYSSISNLKAYHLIDYNLIVDTFLMAQGVPGRPKEFYEDPFHPGVLPSVIYVDSVLQWASSVVR